MHSPSSSSWTVALVASAAVLASQAQALPTHRSTSTIARRAHIASHHQHGTRATATDAATTLGDHSIVVDASTSSPGAAGGIKNSTINLTSISKRTAREGTLASFSRVVRSLFGRAVPPAPEVFKALPLTYSPPVASSSSSASRAHTTKNKKRHAGHKKRRTVKKPRAGAPLKGNTRTLASGLILELPDSRGHKHVTNVKRQRSLALRADNERRAMMYTLAQAQASAYSVAVAALGDSLPTASPIVNAMAAAPTSFAGDESSAPSSTLVFVDEPAATASPADATASAATAAPDAREPVTLTITLVPSGPNGALINAAALATASASAPSSPALAAAASPCTSSSITVNPKASASAPAFASLAAVSAYTPPSAPSASAAPVENAPASAALSAVKRGMERRTVARKRAPAAVVVKAAVAPAHKWYPA
ncbi:hypothetical protein JCM3770_002890 [Rhodotorula araucariae]